MLAAFLAYLPYLAATLVLEALIVWRVAPRALRRRALLVCLAANTFTHPFATIMVWRWGAMFPAIEVVVTLMEMLLYLRLVPLSPGRAAVAAVLSNLVTAVAALLLWSAAMA